MKDLMGMMGKAREMQERLPEAAGGDRRQWRFPARRAAGWCR